MESSKGETLAERMARGPLPPNQRVVALEVACNFLW